MAAAAAASRSVAGCAYCAATATTRLLPRFRARRTYATSSSISSWKNDEGSAREAANVARWPAAASSSRNPYNDAPYSNLSLYDRLNEMRKKKTDDSVKESQKPVKQSGRSARNALMNKPMQKESPVSSFTRRDRRLRPILIPFPRPRARRPKERTSFFHHKVDSKGKGKANQPPPGSDGGFGKDTLLPTSESGLPESSSSDPSSSLSPIFSPEFRARAKTEDMIAEMDKVMAPLIENCRQATSTRQGSNTRELKQLEEWLRRSISIYKDLKKGHKRWRHQGQFMKVVATSKWNDDRETWIKGITEDRQKQQALIDELSSATSGGVYSSSALSDSDAPPIIDTSLSTISGKSVSISTIAPPREIPVARLAHGLERVLFNPGIHWLQDPKSKYYNYTQAIQNVMPKERFDFEQLPRFIPPSQDEDLKELLKASGRTFAGSTSSLTSAMSHIYFALNGKKLLNTQTPNFVDEPRTFTASSQLPASIVLNRTPEGTYLIDADKSVGSDSGTNVLSMLGNVLEKFLTYEPKEFERFDVESKNPFKPEESREKREAYHYSGTDTLLMRSQLDCHDDRLPRKTFDIKTRATIAIRRDILNHAHGAGYTIHKALGYLESFEREKYDLIRAAFLKYSFQARIGKMDGIFLAYHSTERIFGFEYLPLEEIDKYISGSHEESTQAYHLCVMILEAVLKRVIADIPDQSLRLSFDSKDSALQVLSSPLGDDSASPLKLYDIQLTNYLNGIEMKSHQVIDFASVPGFSSPSSISSTPQKEVPSETVNEPDWTVAYDIVVNEDEAYNRKRLERMRKRQTSFTKKVILPEGLSPEEIERAVNQGKKKGEDEGDAVNVGVAGIDKEQVSGEADQKESKMVKTLVEDEKPQDLGAQQIQATQAKAFASINNTNSVTAFVPRPGVSYVLRPYGMIARLRVLARKGRAQAAKIFGITRKPAKKGRSKAK